MPLTNPAPVRMRIVFSKSRVRAAPALVVAVALAAALAATAGPHLSPWSTAQKVDEIAGNNAELNTPFIDGCPIESPDGLDLYMASNRPGSMESAPGVRSLDIWVAHRETRNAPFGAPVTLGPAVNSTADDFCQVVFSSNRGGSTGQDISVSVRDHADDPWSPPTRLGIEVNTAAAETRPSLSGDGQRLYFGRAPGPEGMSDIYLATREKVKGPHK
jgi:WD40-like Beta Propeller Repeat